MALRERALIGVVSCEVLIVFTVGHFYKNCISALLTEIEHNSNQCDITKMCAEELFLTDFYFLPPDQSMVYILWLVWEENKF
jgi:hypothetical protein